MKVSFAFALLIFAITIQAQSASYSVECPKPDSCFLREISTGPVTAQDPRPQTVTSYRLFRSAAEFEKIVSDIRAAGAKKLEEGMKIVEEARGINAIADKIQAAWPKK